MAEGILRHKAQQKGLNIQTDSCGTGDWHVGQKADSRAINTSLLSGVDINDLRGRQFRISDFSEFDHILVMDQNNYADVISLAETDSQRSKVKMLMNFLHPGKDEDVPDSYYGNDTDFKKVFLQIDQAIDAFLDQSYANL